MYTDYNLFCNRIDSLLSPFGARRLSSSELERYKPESGSIVTGWLINTELVLDNIKVSLALLLRQSAPYSYPTVFVHTPVLEPLSYPHIEKNGKLCIWPSTFIVDPSDCKYILELLKDAITLLDRNFKGQYDKHFLDEFLSYWIYHKHKKNYHVTCSCDPENRQSRETYVFSPLKSKYYIFADSPAELESLLDNLALLPSKERKSKRRKIIQQIRPSALFALEEPWKPSEYPTTCSELISLLEEQTDTSPNDISGLISSTLSNTFTDNPCCLISFNTPTGYCFAATIFSQNFTTKINNRSLRDGFRETIPESIFRARLSTLQINSAVTLDRVDLSWVIGRDNNPDVKDLQKCGEVVIVGCGSVGGAVARLLVQSGVKRLVLIDNDNLEIENISRHCLGFRGIHQNKANYLATSLKRDFPHTEIKAYNKTWQDAKNDKSNLVKNFEHAELIVSCTADWFSDQGLLALQSENDFAPIVFSFTEAHAMAGHVIVNPCDSNAFNSLHHLSGTNVGSMKTTATSWPEETMKKIPACGGTFQPYGVVPLTHLHALTAEIVLGLLLGHLPPEPLWHVWFGARERLTALKGTWSNDWCEKFGDPGDGSTMRKFILGSSGWENYAA